MRVAVPLFGRDVAPRFGFADSFLIVEIENGQVTRTTQITVDSPGFASRLSWLKELEVEVLLCGGFNRSFVPLAEDLGMSIHAGLTGDALKIVEAFLRGEAMPVFTCMGAGRRKRRGRGCDEQSPGQWRSKIRRSPENTTRPFEGKEE